VLSRVIRLSKKNTIYIPKDIAEQVGVREGDLLEIRVENGRIVLTPIHDPFWLALKAPKYARLTVEEVEAISEEEQESTVKNTT
jgi:antitoxin MazE